MTTPLVSGSTDPRLIDINDRVARLARARRTAAEAAARIRELRAAFEATHADEARHARETQATADAAETALRAVVAEYFAATQDKKPAPGIEVKERRTFGYQEHEAFAWAKQAGIAILPERLDAKAFEKICRATPLDFVYEVVEPMVTIATDLDKALSIAAVTAAGGE